MTTMVEDPWIGAACREPGVNAAWFFPARGNDQGEKAKRVCRECPIRQRCGEYIMALESRPGTRYRFGVWSGMTPRERSRLARDLGLA